MAITNATSLADFGTGIGTAGATLTVDNDTDRIGIGTDTPQGMLQVGTAITMGGNTGIISAVTYNADSGVNVGSAVTIVGATGIVSATSFYGDGSGLTGISAGSFSSNDTGISTTTAVGIGTTDATGAADPKNTAVVNVGVVTAVTTFSNVVGTAATFTSVLATGLSGSPDVTVTNITGTAATFTGTVTYEDVTNVDSVGVVTARGGFEVGASGVGGTITSVGDAEFTGVVTATTYYGDGSNLSGIEAGISTTAGITTGAVRTLNLGSYQDHKETVTGFVTFSSTGGSEGDSHTIRIINSGIATVGFNTYFLWPSGSSPTMPTTDGAISLISFTVQRVGTAGTQLLSGASLDFS